jgi:hypothetical protein
VLPALVRVTALLTCVPFLTVPKFNEDGVNRMAVPVPDKATVRGAGYVAVAEAQAPGDVTDCGWLEFGRW